MCHHFLEFPRSLQWLDKYCVALTANIIGLHSLPDVSLFRPFFPAPDILTRPGCHSDLTVKLSGSILETGKLGNCTTRSKCCQEQSGWPGGQMESKMLQKTPSIPKWTNMRRLHFSFSAQFCLVRHDCSWQDMDMDRTWPSLHLTIYCPPIYLATYPAGQEEGALAAFLRMSEVE